MKVDKKKLDVANAVLKTFNSFWVENSFWIEPRKRGIYVCWEGRGGAISKRWACRGGQDFYPIWHTQWSGDGRESIALSQLIRWLRWQSVLSIETWRYWSSERVKLLPISAVEMLAEAGYPQESVCVLCGNRVGGGIDWWNLDGVSGPCCSWNSGCCQKGKPH